MADASPVPRALLLTDIVDSTLLTERLGDAAMAELWAVHDRLARDLLPAWRGREIDKTDGMLLLFDTAADALGYALAYHRSLQARGLPLAARAGIHVGPVSLRANPADDVARGAKPLEVNGLALPLTARVMSLALGGQTLLSADARQALGAVPQRVLSHGHWRLQGLAEPVELFEIGDDDAPFTPPKDAAKAQRVVRHGDLWLPLRELPHSLPAERDSFVGRRAMLQALAAKLDGGARLVSVLGIGGAGKTRLATRAAWMQLAHYPGGAWFCDLSQARSIDGIHFAVAQGLQLALGGADPAAQLAQAIAGRGRCLVVLDNFEQVARHAEATLGRWLDRAPQAQFVATTREVLGIVGEEILPLAPLDPDDAVELFARRASAARLGYAPGAEDHEAIRQLVKVLDGLPLAIELAAARVRVMPPRTLVARMRDRFDLLFSRGGRHDRQATLRAAFDWSWELMSEREREVLALLSVFEGGFTLDAAGAVIDALADASAAAQPPVIDVVQWLVDKSFVRQVSDERFDLLETVREYAAGHLRSPGSFAGSGPERAAAVQAAHWRHFARLDEPQAVAGRCIEANNLVAACRAATAAGDGAAATGGLMAAWAALRLTGPYRVAVQLAHGVAALDTLGANDRALVHWVAGSAFYTLGEVEPARAHFMQGLAAAVPGQATAARARLLLDLGTVLTSDGQLDAARANLDEALRLARDLGDPRLQMRVLNELGVHMDRQSRWDEARDYYERALAVARSLGDRHMEGGLLGNLGGLRHDRGELDAAGALFEQSVAIAVEVGDRRFEGNGRCNLGLLLQEQGRDADALAQFDQALAIARVVGHVRLAYTVQCNLGILLTAQGRLAEAGEHLQQAVDAAASAADRRAEGQFRGYLALNLARRGRIAEARAALDTGDALLLAMADRLSHALLLCDRAEVEALDHRHGPAQQAWQAARDIAVELDCGSDSELGRRLAAVGAALPVA